jgi:type II secretory pathway component GspD/PulD (secretin)
MDFGELRRAADCGFEDSIRHRKSTIRHRPALLGWSKRSRPKARFGPVLACVLLTCIQANAAGQSTSLHEVFEAVISDNDSRIQAVPRRPIVSQTQWIAPAGNHVWQPKSTPRGGQLTWGARLAQAEVPPAEVTPTEEMPLDATQAEVLPPQGVEGTIPLAGSPPADAVQMKQYPDGTLDLIVRDFSLSQVLSMLAQTHGLNIVAANDIDALISITLRRVPIEEALTAILSVANYTWVQRNNIILVTSLADPTLPADVQDRQIQVFELDFASAQVVAEAITNFLTPVGKVSISPSDPADSRKARELVVVEDTPTSLARIAAYIDQVDCPPRQVLIEAHILQVNLDDTCAAGVDFAALLRFADQRVNIISVPSLSVPIPTPGAPTEPSAPALVATLSGGDLNGVIELIQTTTDSKTLGSPKLLVLNEQEARLQVGDQLGFKVTTTTETSTLESVQFLDVGVVLTIRPRITRDGHVLLNVKPEVSTGEVNPETGLPEESTTELETDVMLSDGQGMVIGGLIKETDSVAQRKVPYLGDIKGLGWLFKHSEVTKERVEIIVALVPRIQPYDAQWQAFEQGELVKAGVPLLDPQRGPLLRNYRPWDPVLPDGKRIYRPVLPRNGRGHHSGYAYEMGSGYVVPPYPLPEQNFYGACDDELPAPASNGFQQPFLSDEATSAPHTVRERPRQR